MIKPLPISWFYENLPDEQLIEDKFKEIIRRNYMISWFISIKTPVVERLEILTSKWGIENEIYWIHRLSWEKSDDASLWLRFDLTVPLARYVAQYEWVLTFPFKRQQISKVYRWERPQKWRFREFYQADIDIIWNWKLPLFADVEVIFTIFNALKELNFWDFIFNINNKKFLEWFLKSIKIEKIAETIWIIDKKDKVKTIVPMLKENNLDENQISEVLKFIKIWEEKGNIELIEYFKNSNNELLKEWIWELEYVYNNLLFLWIDKKYLKINPAISRWLNYYTWTVFETFIVWAENIWSISSGGRYENLCSSFTKNNYPWVWWSIWLTRLIFVLKELGKINKDDFSKTNVMIINWWDKFLENNLKIIKILREKGIISELYLDSDAKIQKQLKYADNKKFKYVIICLEDEMNKWVVQLKNLWSWEQVEVGVDRLVEKII